MRRFRFGVLVVSVLVLSLAVSSFAQVVVLKASLGDASYQTDDTLGQATLVVDGARVVYDINLFFAGGISSAVITRLNETLPTIDLHGSSSNTRASGVVTVAAPQASALMANPTSFVVRIAASGGDLIGLLTYAGNPSSGPTTAFLPLVAHNHGQAGSVWRTDLHLTSLSGANVEVVLDYFPMSAGTDDLPAASRTVTVVGTGQLVLRDVLGVLFGHDNERGALRLSANGAFGARARLYNVAPGEVTAVSGATSLYSRALQLSEVPFSGTLLGLTNRTGVSGDGFRTNVVFFNPTDRPVTVTLFALRDDGTLLGSGTMTVGTHANDVKPVFDLITSAAPDGLEQGSFLLKYFASGPLIVQATEIDAAAGDGVLIDPVAGAEGWPQPPPSQTTLDGIWWDRGVLVSENSINVCGRNISWREWDSTFERQFQILQEGTSVSLCGPDWDYSCYEGALQGNRLVVRLVSESGQPEPWCSQYSLTIGTESTIDVSLVTEYMMLGTETLKWTYYGGPQPVEHIATYNLVMLKE